MSGFDCSPLFDAQQVLCKRALDILNSVLSKKSSCRQLWLSHECSDKCHVPVLSGCSALKNIPLLNKKQPISTQKWGLWKKQMVSWPVLSLKIALLYSNTDQENYPTNLDINFYPFSNSLEAKSAKANSGERQYPLMFNLIASKLQSGKD